MLTRLATPEHEEVYRVEDVAAGLEGYIAIHSTALGPAAGGLRMRLYHCADAALEDVLNLARGMSFKNAAAGLPLGGGKAVILGDPNRDKTPALLRAMARAVQALEGRYWTAEDIGMTPADMGEIARETRFVAGLDKGRHASGDPSPVTAAGVMGAMQIGARAVFGSRDLTGLRVAVQGIGHVGWHLARMLSENGARLVLTDTDAARLDRAAADFGADVVSPGDIYAAVADIFAPCAIGGVLDHDTIPRLRARLVAGAANNQLAGPDDAARLAEHGILYLPDYVANGGGIINVAAEILQIDEAGPWVAGRLAAMQSTMERILSRARAIGVTPADMADRMIGEMLLRPAV